jgi:hypothetical protein
VLFCPRKFCLTAMQGVTRHDHVQSLYEDRALQTADPKGTRNPRPAARRVPSRSQEGGEGQGLNSAQTEEVATQTAPGPGPAPAP